MSNNEDVLDEEHLYCNMIEDEHWGYNMDEEENVDVKSVEEENVDGSRGEEEHLDYTRLFVNGFDFEKREEALDWVQQVGHAKKMYFSITTSRSNVIYLGCERGGQFVDSNARDKGKRVFKRQRKSSGTKKIGCKFQVRLVEQKDGRWRVKMGSHRGRHNHKLGKIGNWHPSYVKLSNAQSESIRRLTKSNMKPKQILCELRGTNPGINLRQINNAKVKFKIEDANGLGPMAVLFKDMSEKGYYIWDEGEKVKEKAVEGEKNVNRLTNIMFAHPDSIKLLKRFPHVLIIDGTYCTNQHHLPLIEIIGVVPTGKNFHIAFAFVKNETAESFRFVYRGLKEMYKIIEGAETDEEIKGPGVILTDRELACLKAIEELFPSTQHLLCRRHISQDVRKNVQSFIGKREDATIWVDFFAQLWHELVNMPTVEKYEECLKTIEHDWAMYPKILKYIRNTWLDPYRTRFVSAWTDEYMHYGNLTTNRVEGAHSQLKNWFGTARNSLDTCFAKIHTLVELQNSEIRTSFEKSRNVLPHMTRYKVFRLLGGELTHKAIDLLVEESRGMGPCNCVIRKTHGLPCKCEMQKLDDENLPVEVSMISPFWRATEVSEEVEKPSAKVIVEKAFSSFIETASEASMYQTSSMLHKLAYPESCGYEEPSTVKTKGRPKNCVGQRYIGWFEQSRLSAAKKVASDLSKVGGVTIEDASGVVVSEIKDFEMGDGSGRGRGRSRGNGRGRGRGRGARGGGRGRGNVEEVSGTGDVVTLVAEKGVESGNGRGRGRRGGRGRGRGVGIASGSCVSTGASFPFMKEIPQCIIKFILTFLNVAMDGNCGYRAIAFWKYGDEERWDDVRKALSNEVSSRLTFWAQFFDVDRVLGILDFHESPAPEESWFEIQQMGLVVATVYQVVFCCFAKNSVTFLPVRWDSNSEIPDVPNTFSIAKIESLQHFVVLSVDCECPLPPLYPKWDRIAEPRIRHWAEHLKERITIFKYMERIK